MRMPLENLQSEATFFGQPKFAAYAGHQSKNVIRIWIILLTIAAAFLSCPQAVGGRELSRQEIGVKERLEAERRLWELGYWAGPIDGKFDCLMTSLGSISESRTTSAHRAPHLGRT
jgi:hypothetical protein